MGLCLGKPEISFPTRTDTNESMRLEKIARSVNLCIKEDVELYYPCGENKGVIGIAVTAKLICVTLFSHMLIVGICF